MGAQLNMGPAALKTVTPHLCITYPCLQAAANQLSGVLGVGRTSHTAPTLSLAWKAHGTQTKPVPGYTPPAGSDPLGDRQGSLATV